MLAKGRENRTRHANTPKASIWKCHVASASRPQAQTIQRAMFDFSMAGTHILPVERHPQGGHSVFENRYLDLDLSLKVKYLIIKNKSGWLCFKSYIWRTRHVTSLSLSLSQKWHHVVWALRSLYLEELIIKPTSIMEMKASDQDSLVGTIVFHPLITDRHIIGILLRYPFWFTQDLT